MGRILMSYTNKRLFSRFLNKAVSMALWTKAGLRGESLLSERSLPSTPNRLKTSINPVKIRVNPWQFVAKILRVFVVKKSVLIRVNLMPKVSVVNK